MGGSIALGLDRKTSDGDVQVLATAAHAESLRKFEDTSVQTSTDNRSATQWGDIIILGVKPYMVEEILDEISTCLEGKILVSLAAGILPGTLLEKGGRARGIFTAIPNLAAEVGESMTFILKDKGGEEEVKTVVDLFEKVGKVQLANEKKLKAGTMVASCGTAFAMRYIRASMLGGVQLGLKPKEALEAAVQTVLGAAKLLEERGTNPEEEIDRVTTPGGITIKGLTAMEKAGFSSSVIEGLLAWK